MENNDQAKASDQIILDLITTHFNGDRDALIERVKQLSQKPLGRRKKPKYADAQFYIYILLLKACSKKKLTTHNAIKLFIDKEITPTEGLIEKSTSVHATKEPNEKERLLSLYDRLHKQAQEDPEWMNYTFSEIDDELKRNQ